MGKTNALKWFPLDVDSWLFGSTRLELAADESAVWIDFCALGAKDGGFIRANVGFPYPIPILAGLLGRDVELVERTIAKCLTTHSADPNESPKLTKLGDGTLYITNWEKYQFTPRWVRKLNKMNESPNNSSNEESGSLKMEPYNIMSYNVSSHKKKETITFNHETHDWVGITELDILEWGRAYPAVLVVLELKQMAQWIISNPEKGHKSRWRMFITNWLKRSQDRGGSNLVNGGPGRERPIPGRDVGRNPKRQWTLDDWQRTRDIVEKNVKDEGAKAVAAGDVTEEEYKSRVAGVMLNWDRDHPKPSK